MARQFRSTKKTGGLELTGIDEVYKVLGKMDERLARGVLRGAPNAAAGVARKAMRDAAPRRTGTLRRAIKNARRDSRTEGPGAVVFVEQGKQAKADGFYWRFVEFGTVKMPARPFMRPTLDRLAASGALARAMADYIRTRWDRAVAKAARR